MTLYFFFLDDEGSGDEESGSGCDSPSCETDRDIYFSTPANPSIPRVGPVVVGHSAANSHGSTVAAALCCLGLALLAHLR